MAVKIHVLAISKQKCKCVKVQGGITQNDMRGIHKKGILQEKPLNGIMPSERYEIKG